MKNFLIGLFTFIGTTGISAQTQSITVHSQTTGKEEIIDVPESMQSEMDSLYWDWQSKNHITLGENCTMASTNPVVSDSIYMDRLSRIPSIIEMPYNEAVRKFIDMYAVRLRNKVSFMLAATNFYMPIFEEALDLYVQKKDMTYLSLAYASKERLRNYDNFKKSLNQIFDDNKETYYIPAGRSMLTLLVNNRSLIESNNLDLITRQYMQIIDNIHGVFEDGIRNAHKRYPDEERKFDVNKITDTLVANLKGDYQYIAGKEYIIIQDEEKQSGNRTGRSERKHVTGRSDGLLFHELPGTDHGNRARTGNRGRPGGI